jgi:soluble lytic murein transglycosylase-like protein
MTLARAFGRYQRRPSAALLAILGLSTCGGSVLAYAEIAVKAAKTDKAIVIASLEWQPNDPAKADWVAFKPNAGLGADIREAAKRSSDPFDAAFNLFATPQPVKLSDNGGFALRTASIDPDAAWIPGAQRVVSDASKPSAGLPATVGANPIEQQVHLGFVIPPIPRAKPPVPRVQLASLTSPTELPDAESHARALDDAPILGEPRRIPEGATAYLDIFRREASLHKIPLWLALGVAWVESKFDPKLRGTHTVVGMMQVMPSTAREMGYRGTTNQLFNPETNIIWGMKELAKDYEIAKGDICLTIAKYKGGFRTQSINKGAWNYCSQVKRVTGMAELATAAAKTTSTTR